MAKKMFSYTETIKITVYVACESKEEASQVGNDFVEGVLDHMQTEFDFCKNQGAREFEVETVDFVAEEE
jgi:hypothetical protein